VLRAQSNHKVDTNVGSLYALIYHQVSMPGEWPYEDLETLANHYKESFDSVAWDFDQSLYCLLEGKQEIQ